ncbi:hypothetical protein Peur_006892 [Populus x canadensis]
MCIHSPHARAQAFQVLCLRRNSIPSSPGNKPRLPMHLQQTLIPSETGDDIVYVLIFSLLCKPKSLDHEKAKGKVVVCLRGETGRMDKGYQAALVGAAGMILCNDKASGNEIIADPHVLPAAQITYTDGLAVFAYINSTDHALGYISAPTAKLGTKPAPSMAAFSSRGPNIVTPEILKPDITAPGVNIIAAFSEAISPTDFDFDKRKSPFITESGTSMSCPHVAGAVGLLKTLHPDWSPAAIRSAIMTTARTRSNTMTPMVDGRDGLEATPFSYGSGHIRPNRAQDPGLVSDLSINDYLDFLASFATKQKCFGRYPNFQSCQKQFLIIPQCRSHPYELTGAKISLIRDGGSPHVPPEDSALLAQSQLRALEVEDECRPRVPYSSRLVEPR